MTSSLIPLTEGTLSLGLAYLLHSTLLLLGVAVCLRFLRTTSHTLRERLWKLAVVVPLVTAPLQVGSGVAPIPEGWQFSVATVEVDSPAPVAAEFGTDPEDRLSPELAPHETRDRSMAEYHRSVNRVFPSIEETVRSLRPGVAPMSTPSAALQPSSLPDGAGRGSSPVAGQRVGDSGSPVETPTTSEVPEASIAPATRISPATLPGSGRAESRLTVSPVAELPPVDPRPATPASPPRTGPWPPSVPAKPPRSELTSVELTVAQAGRKPELTVSVSGVAFGMAAAILASVCGGLVLLVIQRARFRTRMRKCLPVEEGVTRRELDVLLHRKRISRPVRLLVSDGFAEPVACGVLRWTIIVPHGVEQRLDREQIKGLLAHELAHLVRGDTTWLWVGTLVCSCLWFQPLNFLARRRWQQAAEFLSDEWAVVDAHASSLALAQCLTQIAEWRLDRQESGAILAAGGHRSSLSSRIDCLVQGERPADVWKSRRRKRAVLLGVLAVGISLVWIVPQAEFARAGFPADQPEKTVRVGSTQAATPADLEGGTPVSDSETPSAAPGTFLTGQGNDSTLENANTVPAAVRSENWRTEWNELQAELKGLNADLIRAAELLEKYPANPRVREMAEQVRAKAVSFENRRRNLDARLKAAQNQAAELDVPSPFYLEDDVEYFPRGPELRLPRPD